MIVYPEAVDAFMVGDVDLLSDTIKAQLVDSSYVVASPDDFLAAVPAPARIGTAGTLTGKSVVAGEFFAADVTLGPIAAGDTIAAVVLYQDTGVEATSRLLADITRKADTVPLAVATTGGTITLSWLGGRVFKI